LSKFVSGYLKTEKKYYGHKARGGGGKALMTEMTRPLRKRKKLRLPSGEL